MGQWSGSLRGEKEGAMESSRGSDIQAVECAKALGYERLDILEQQKGAHG